MGLNNFCDGSKCSRCGECCTLGIPITKHEEKKIRKYIEENNITPENIFTDGGMYFDCCFHDRKNKCCKIYPVRPNICKSFKCNRNEDILEREKEINHERAYWNHIGKDGQLKNCTSFDLLFYGDARPIIQIFYDMFCDKNGKLSSGGFEKMKKKMRSVGLEELADSMRCSYEE